MLFKDKERENYMKLVYEKIKEILREHNFTYDFDMENQVINLRFIQELMIFLIYLFYYILAKMSFV